MVRGDNERHLALLQLELPRLQLSHLHLLRRRRLLHLLLP